MSISSITTPSTYQYTPTTTSTTSSSSSSSSPVVASSDKGLAQEVSALTTNAGVIATLGSSSSATGTYDAAGLYNSIAEAGTSATVTPLTTQSSASSAATTASQSLDSSVVSTLPQSSTASGVYTSSGTTTSAGSSNLSSNWSSALKENPNLSKVVSADSFAQGIIGTISTTA